MTYSPSPVWSLVAALALAAWLAATWGLTRRGFDDNERLRRLPALAYGMCIAAGIGLFLYALSRA